MWGQYVQCRSLCVCVCVCQGLRWGRLWGLHPLPNTPPPSKKGSIKEEGGEASLSLCSQTETITLSLDTHTHAHTLNGAFLGGPTYYPEEKSFFLGTGSCALPSGLKPVQEEEENHTQHHRCSSESSRLSRLSGGLS